MRIGFLGGSFDPVHLGHLAIARECRAAADLDRVVFVVAGQPPHKLDRVLAPAPDRVEMVRRATAGDPHHEVDTREIQREGVGYTIDTVRELVAERPRDELFWIIGADTLPELPTWRSAAELIDLVGILTATRPGFDMEAALTSLQPELGSTRVARLRAGLVPMPPVGVSSTEIRRRIAAGLSITDLVPGAVADYIAAEALYA